MKTRIRMTGVLLMGAFLGVSVMGADAFRQVYPLAPQQAKANAAKVAADLNGAPAAWRNAPAVYYTVPPLSDVIRLPDTYPADGTALGTLQIVAAKGEFEPGSIVIYPQRNVDEFELKVSALKSAAGASIPAAAVDIKLLKVWFQGGGAWFHQQADTTARMLIPEILLNDEDLIRVDGEDNYVRYSNADGSTQYQWMSAPGMMTGYRRSNYENLELVSDDADKLLPVVLNQGEFKQFMVTLGVPKTAREGLYAGAIGLVADGKAIGAVPLQVRVLPFELPVAKTYYDMNKQFMLHHSGTGMRNPKIARNLVNHNHTVGPRLNTFNPAQTDEDVKILKDCGASDASFAALFDTPSAGYKIMGTPPTLNDANKLRVLKSRVAKTAELTQRLFGHTDFYCYGLDEAGPAVVRMELPAWEIIHEDGGKVQVSTHARGRLLYALDYMWQPGSPTDMRSEEARKFHDMNPKGLVGWYADPHGGPENPNYARRLYGLQAYKAHFDVVGNYTWWRSHQWNDIAQNCQHTYRNLNVVYLTSGGVLDTIQWEGCREGMDDVRYATKMKELALQAIESGNSRHMLRGRLALGLLAYWDGDRDDLDACRMECINYILELDHLLKGGKQ